MFGLFSGSKEERQKKAALRHGATLKKQMTNKDQRAEAIDALLGIPPQISIPQLMKRFEMVVDHGIQDTREKERILEYLIEHQDVARPIVVEALKNQARIAWPIRLAEQMHDEKGYLDLLLECLKTEYVSFDESVQERNIEITLALKELSDPRIAEKVAPLLESRDENVRMAALECLEAQAEKHEPSRHLLTNLLKEEVTDDNSRFLGMVRSIVEKHKWETASE